MIYIISLSDIATASHQHHAYYEPINLILSITLYARIVKRQGYPLSPRRIWWWNVSKIHASWFTVSIAINTDWSIGMFIQVSLIGSRLRRHGSSGSEAHWKTRICFKSVWEKYHACWSYIPPPPTNYRSPIASSCLHRLTSKTGAWNEIMKINKNK